MPNPKLANPTFIRLLLIAALTLTLGAGSAHAAPAAPAAIVEGLQMPAWVEHQNVFGPLRVGMPLEAGDRIVTGPNSRVLLRLAEGSLVKLGENAELVVSRFEPPEAEGGLFSGFLDVLKGAFRYTTTALSRQHRRALDIRVSGVTAGIRGTDLWGKAAADKDIVCLIEGNITVQHGEDAPITMDEALSFYVAPKDASPLPIGPVDPDQLARWALETELQAGGGVMRADGEWTAHLKSHRNQAFALSSRDELHAAGYATEIQPAKVDGQSWFRVSVPGFESASEARAFTSSVEGRFGISGAWVDN